MDELAGRFARWNSGGEIRFQTRHEIRHPVFRFPNRRQKPRHDTTPLRDLNFLALLDPAEHPREIIVKLIYGRRFHRQQNRPTGRVIQASRISRPELPMTGNCALSKFQSLEKSEAGILPAHP
jgi:hypothetical protein